MLKFRDFHRAGALVLRFLRFMPFPLGLLFIFTFASEQYFEYLSQLLNTTEQGPWPAQLGEFCFSVIESFAQLLLVGYFLVNLFQQTTWLEFFRRHLAPLTAESLRALTSILYGLLLAIVPGIVRYCRFYLVPFIVYVDPTYQSRPDALARAKELTDDCWVRFTFLILGLGALETGFELGPSLLKIDDLIPRLIFDFCGFIFSLYCLLVVYVVFDNLRAKIDAEPVPAGG